MEFSRVDFERSSNESINSQIAQEEITKIILSQKRIGERNYCYHIFDTVVSGIGCCSGARCMIQSKKRRKFQK